MFITQLGLWRIDPVLTEFTRLTGPNPVNSAIVSKFVPEGDTLMLSFEPFPR